MCKICRFHLKYFKAQRICVQNKSLGKGTEALMISDCFLLSTDIFPKMKYFNSFLIAILNFLNQTYHRKICRIVFIEGMEFFLCSFLIFREFCFDSFTAGGWLFFDSLSVHDSLEWEHAADPMLNRVHITSVIESTIGYIRVSPL